MKKLTLEKTTLRNLATRDLRFVSGGAPDDMETVICTLGRACDRPTDLCVTNDCTEHGCG